MVSARHDTTYPTNHELHELHEPLARRSQSVRYAHLGRKGESEDQSGCQAEDLSGSLTTSLQVCETVSPQKQR